jgi:transglutaminase-like putative cysteine protease
MSVIFDIVHRTRYEFHREVQLDRHRMLFRPRGSHDLRVLATDLVVSPEPVELHLLQDAYSNSVASFQPASPAASLEIVATFTVEHTGTRALDLPLDPAAAACPPQYSPAEQPVLAPFIAPFYDDPSGRLAAWAQQFIGAGDTRAVLVAMTRHIRETMRYVARTAQGVQTPYQTLDFNSGSCRDFATLMIEAARQLGIAARFVSGYLYCADLDPAQDGAGQPMPGATHAWVEACLPSAGWLPFDPTNNLIGGTDLVRVGVACHASQAVPVSGEWFGYPADFGALHVDVQVSRRS